MVEHLMNTIMKIDQWQKCIDIKRILMMGYLNKCYTLYEKEIMQRKCIWITTFIDQFLLLLVAQLMRKYLWKGNVFWNDFIHSLRQQGVWVSLGHPNPQKSPLGTPKCLNESFQAYNWFFSPQYKSHVIV